MFHHGKSRTISQEIWDIEMMKFTFENEMGKQWIKLWISVWCSWTNIHKSQTFLLQNAPYESPTVLLNPGCNLIWYCTHFCVNMYCHCIQAKGTCVTFQHLASASKSSLEQCFWTIPNLLKIVHRMRERVLSYTCFSKMYQEPQRSCQISEVPF